MPFQQIIMHALHYQHDVDVHLLFGFSSLMLTDGYHFACNAQQKLCLFNKSAYMH